MSQTNEKSLYFSLDKSSDPLTVFGAFGTKTCSGSLSAPITIATITVTDSLSKTQVSQFANCLSAPDGPLFHLKLNKLIYNIEAEQHPKFFIHITKDIPAQVLSQDINIIDNSHSIYAHVAARRVAGIMTQTTTIRLDADFDTQSLKPYSDQLLSTTVVEIRPPKSPQTFSAKLDTFKLDMITVLKDFFPEAKSVILYLCSSSYTQSIMQSLGRREILELVHSATATSDIKDLRISVIDSLPHLVNLRELTIPGHIMSHEFFFALGDLQNLRRLNATGTTMPLWGRLCQKMSEKFGALEILDLNCYLDNLLALPYLMKPVRKLRSLVIRVPSLRSPMDQTSWSSISRVFPKVEALSFLVNDLNPSETKEWFTLEDISCLTNIKQLAIRHPMPLKISDNTIQVMLITWPRLFRLSLNPKPFYLPWRLVDRCSNMLPTWNILEYIKQNKLPLRSFSVYLGNPSDVPSVFDKNEEEVNENLERLTIGTYDALPVRKLETLRLAFKKANIVNEVPLGNLKIP